MSLAKAFGDRLAQERREKAARERRDVTQRDVAEAVQLTSAAISRYESGAVIPDDAILQRLADYFGIRRVWLREGEGEREAVKPDPARDIFRSPPIVPETPKAQPKPRKRRAG